MDHRILGIACVVGAVTFFVLQDALIKWLSGDYPLHEIVLVRAASAIVVTLFVMRFEGGIHLLRTRRLGLQLARCTLLIFANGSFYLALAAMTIAEATSLFFVAPLLITALSAIMLRETVGPRRGLAISCSRSASSCSVSMSDSIWAAETAGVASRTAESASCERAGGEEQSANATRRPMDAARTLEALVHIGELRVARGGGRDICGGCTVRRSRSERHWKVDFTCIVPSVAVLRCGSSPSHAGQRGARRV